MDHPPPPPGPWAYYPGCPGDGADSLAAPPSLDARPRWPPGGAPPEQWGSGGGSVVDALHQLRAALEALRAAPDAPLPLSAARQQQKQQAADDAGAPEVHPDGPSMLEWLFTLPAQWAAARFPPDFARFEPWKYTPEKYARLGGGKYHPGDIVCEDPRHVPRTGGTRCCCVMHNAACIMHRILGAADPIFEPTLWPVFAKWAKQGRPEGKRPRPPAVPLDALRRVGPHAAAEGILAAILYCYNVQTPNDMSQESEVWFPDSGSDDLGWELNGLLIKSVKAGGRAAEAGLTARRVVLSVGSIAVASESDIVAALSSGANNIKTVPARCTPRPLQLFGGLNWAMRTRPGAYVEDAPRLDMALAIYRPWLRCLDLFIRKMDKEAALLFRGMARVRTGRFYKMGMRVTYHSFTSLSTDGSVAWKFAGADGGTWVVILATAALPVSWLSTYPAEQELLLPTNCELTVMDKPAESTLAVLTTTNDAFALAQVDRTLPAEEAVAQRIAAMRSQQVVFRELAARYVEPRVQWGRGRGRDSGAATTGAAAEGGDERLFAAFDRWLAGPAQWLLIAAPAGEGKSSALLSLYARQLRATEAGGAVPFFTSLSLVGDPTQKPDWLLRQVRLQMAMDEAELGCLLRRDVFYFCDSADESGAPAAALKERSLAARAGIPSSHKGIISVREEDMARLDYEVGDLVGPDGAVLQLREFGPSEQRRFCEQQSRAAAQKVAQVLKEEPAQTGAARAAALGGIPGRLPDDYVLGQLQDAVKRGDRDGVEHLRERFAGEAAERTLAAVAALSSGEVRSALMFTMAAEVAQDLTRGCGSGAVIEAWLRRRMNHLAARVDPFAWEAAGIGDRPAERVATLMCLAQAVAAALTLQQQWGAQVGPTIDTVEQLCEPLGGEARPSAAWSLQKLLPGVPLRAPDAEDPESRFALPHRSLQEWLAAEWAARAAGRGLRHKAQLIVTYLGPTWAGALGVAASAAARVSAAAQRGAEDGGLFKEREAMLARIQAARELHDREEAAAQLAELAARCSERFGEQSALTAEALLRQGSALRFVDHRSPDAIRALRRASRIYDSLGPDAPVWGKAKSDMLLGAVLCRSAPPGASAQRREGEKLLRGARARLNEGWGEDDGDVGLCDAELAHSLEKCGELREAEQLHRAVLASSERVKGREHPQTLTSLSNLARNLERQKRWREALPMWTRCYESSRRQLPQNHPDVVDRQRRLQNCKDKAKT